MELQCGTASHNSPNTPYISGEFTRFRGNRLRLTFAPQAPNSIQFSVTTHANHLD